MSYLPWPSGTPDTFLRIVEDSPIDVVQSADYGDLAGPINTIQEVLGLNPAGNLPSIEARVSNQVNFDGTLKHIAYGRVTDSFTLPVTIQWSQGIFTEVPQIIACGNTGFNQALTFYTADETTISARLGAVRGGGGAPGAGNSATAAWVAFNPPAALSDNAEESAEFGLTEGSFSVGLTGTDSDELVKVTTGDFRAGYLDAKITAGTGITTTVLTPGLDESLEISLDPTYSEGLRTQLKCGWPYDPDTGYGVTLGYSGATRQCFIYPTGSTFDVWCGGTKYTFTGVQVFDAHADVTDEYFFYYSPSGTMVTSTSPWSILKDSPTMSVTYNATSSTGAWVLNELHTAGRNLEMHYRLHFGGGTALSSNPGQPTIGDYTLNTNTTDAVTFSATAVTVMDEDIELTTQPLLDATGYRVFYQNGATPDWELQTSYFGDGKGIPFLTNGTTICYNQNNAGTWQKTALSLGGAGQWVNVYLVASTEIDPEKRYFIIPGQQAYSSENDATNEDPSTAISWGDVAPEEYVLCARFTYNAKTAFGATTHYAELVAVELLNGTRSTPVASAGVTDHGALIGLTDVADHPGYVTLDGTRPLTSTWDLNGQEIQTSAAPSVGNSLTNRTYVDTLAGFLLDHGNLNGRDDDDHTGYLVKNPSTSARNLLIPGAKSAIPLTIQAHPTQTADLINILDSFGTEVFVIEAGTTIQLKGPLQLNNNLLHGVTTLSGYQNPVRFLNPPNEASIRLPVHTSTPTTSAAGDIILTDQTGQGFAFQSSYFSGNFIGTEIQTIAGARNQNGITTAGYHLGAAANASTQFRSEPIWHDSILFLIGIFHQGTVTNTDFMVRRNGTDVHVINRSSNPTYPNAVLYPVYSEWSAGEMPQMYTDPTPGGDSINLPYMVCYFRRKE